MTVTEVSEIIFVGNTKKSQERHKNITSLLHLSSPFFLTVSLLQNSELF